MLPSAGVLRVPGRTGCSDGGDGEALESTASVQAPRSAMQKQHAEFADEILYEKHNYKLLLLLNKVL